MKILNVNGSENNFKGHRLKPIEEIKQLELDIDRKIDLLVSMSYEIHDFFLLPLKIKNESDEIIACLKGSGCWFESQTHNHRYTITRLNKLIKIIENLHSEIRD